MQLYVYEHCPYCIRARMIFGLKKLNFTLTILSNDDEQTPISFIGKKVLPILKKPDANYLPESLDIVRWVDNNFTDKVLIGQQNPAIARWIEQTGNTVRHLIFPRDTKIGFEEFKTLAAQQYFIDKKQAYIGDFASHLNNTEQLILQVQQLLQQLVHLIQTADACNTRLSEDDILLYPILWQLTMVKGLIFPAPVLNYINSMAKQTNIEPLFKLAI